VSHLIRDPSLNSVLVHNPSNRLAETVCRDWLSAAALEEAACRVDTRGGGHCCRDDLGGGVVQRDPTITTGGFDGLVIRQTKPEEAIGPSFDIAKSRAARFRWSAASPPKEAEHGGHAVVVILFKPKSGFLDDLWIDGGSFRKISPDATS
jgi:hypothetical protein